MVTNGHTNNNNNNNDEGNKSNSNDNPKGLIQEPHCFSVGLSWAPIIIKLAYF